ncbi:hypothetical protein CGRA01v4_03893 [Colletotrichum graminicola]|uniref:Uncharacterized protein n=1 Tax=Colletotrichum graminicola (strain M1.001 / M2 / FGSC 10212) TaxID=645133 RepID=E3QTX2_COLGM|nr:uncharacterized protein GLRG_09428 [Colletotrichum graminicola M1.001]EFQ34284.1 hypothetical protein GLRG_09428 [Colletotrichum graminicola M1.001]WDK12613.1 hypothetical protein CGRA01v4_03893 [Colletotrichum graminicola]
MTIFKSSKPPLQPEIDIEKARSPSYVDRLQHGLGFLGLATVGGGTALVLGILGFLLFLWSAEGPDDGRGAAVLWRWIMLREYVTQAITLLTVLLRVAITAQASIYTSLIAGVVLERHGVPLSRVAEMSIIRCINDGPLRLAWLLATSARKSCLQVGLVVLLLLTTFTIQFSSTFLVSDLAVSSLIEDATNATLQAYMSPEVISLNRQMNNWPLRPASYMPFGEGPLAADAQPNQLGVSDTKAVRRTFLPVPIAKLSTLRQYDGGTYGFESRFVCMRPSVSAALSVRMPPPFSDTVPFFLQVNGNLSYSTMFREAGLPLPPNCEEGSCFPSSFNCTIPQFQFTQAQARQGLADSLCVPNGTNARPSAQNHTISDEPVTAYSQVFLFFRNNGTYDLWRGPGGRFLVGNFGLRNISATDGEWITWERAIGGRTPEGERLEKGVLRLDMSICFQQLAFNYAEAELSSEKDLGGAQVSWNAGAMAWNTTGVQRLMGIGSYNTNATDRGIFSVVSTRNPRHLNATQYLTNKLINDLYNSPRTNNISIFMDPQGSGISDVKPHVEYQAIFADILNATNRPGVAMQSTLTALSGSIIQEAMPQFDVGDNATMTPSVRVLTPQGFRGLLIVLGVVALNMACGLAVVLVFMVQSRHSSQGNYWQAVAQVVSDETAWILEGATSSSDGHIADELRCADNFVLISQSKRSGRVRVTLK